MAKAKKKSAPKNDGATVGYEAKLWQVADALQERTSPQPLSCSKRA